MTWTTFKKPDFNDISHRGLQSEADGIDPATEERLIKAGIGIKKNNVGKP